ncbi:MAG: hypothetical protein IJ242_03200 [Clostridia bacterium]|nr:hypothetical protein [Clostridia bacterium]
MADIYIDRDAFLAYLESIRANGNPLPGKDTLRENIKEYLIKADKLEIIHCRDCNTFSTRGVAQGYGWCKKFCFGPEENFYCFMGAPWENEAEDPVPVQEETPNDA